jgi:hypothetical protein
MVPRMTHKRAHGQFFTRKSPFDNGLFHAWTALIPDFSSQVLLEPFCGENHIPHLLKEGGINNAWATFDIDPPKKNLLPDHHTTQQDVFSSFPKGFQVCITNPPYLAKNSATRRGLPFPDTPYDDIYKHALNLTLLSVPYVAAIIPESFLVQGLFHDRLFGVVSITQALFEDTEHPVCLALFIPSKGHCNFDVWRDQTPLGDFSTLSTLQKPSANIEMSFNDPKGSIGAFCVDSSKKASIRFCLGKEILPSDIKQTSRAITRIRLHQGDPARVVKAANRILDDYRKSTQDVLLTAFKGLRDDGMYRRRLDFATARSILSMAVQESINDTTAP